MSEGNEIARDLAKQAELLIGAGKLEEAQKKLEEAIKADPMAIDCYKNYGDLCMAGKQYADAKNYYKKALLIEKQGYLYYLYGNACFMNNDEHEGLENYNLAISNGYDTDQMMFFMGMAYEHLNDDKNALRYYQRAQQKNPSRPDFQVRKIHLLVKMDETESALKCTNELIANSPELFDGYHIKNRMLLNMKRFDEALTAAKYAFEKFPEDVELFYDYVRVIASKEEYEQALELISQAKQMKYFADAKRDFIMLEAKITATMADYDRAIACCDACIALEDADSTMDGEARFMKMNLSLVKKDFECALQIAEDFVKANGSDSFYFAALYYRAFCTKQLGRDASQLYKDAVSILRAASLYQPNAVDTYIYRAMAFKDTEQYEKALELLDLVEDLGIEVAELHTIRADIYHLQGKEPLEKQELETAYKLKPELRPADQKDGE